MEARIGIRIILSLILRITILCRLARRSGKLAAALEGVNKDGFGTLVDCGVAATPSSRESPSINNSVLCLCAIYKWVTC